MAFQFNSERHVLNVLNKYNKSNRGDFTERQQARLAEIVSVFWEKENDFDIRRRVEKNGAFKPLDRLTWETMKEKHQNVDSYLLSLSALVNLYDQLTDVDGSKLCEVQIETVKPIIKDGGYKLKDYLNAFIKKQTLKEFESELVNVQSSNGVYFLYDNNKELIYVGKSNVLGKRIVTSVVERDASYYEYALTASASDVAVYEAYYIAKLKPSLNKDSKFHDDLTIELPCIRNHNILPIYEVREVV